MKSKPMLELADVKAIAAAAEAEALKHAWAVTIAIADAPRRRSRDGGDPGLAREATASAPRRQMAERAE